MVRSMWRGRLIRFSSSEVFQTAADPQQQRRVMQVGLARVASGQGWRARRSAWRVRVSGLASWVHLAGLRIAGVDGEQRELLRALEREEPTRLDPGLPESLVLPEAVQPYAGSLHVLRRGPSAFVILPAWRGVRMVIVGPWVTLSDLVAQAAGRLSSQHRRGVVWSPADRAFLRGQPQRRAVSQFIGLVRTVPNLSALPRPQSAPKRLLAYREFSRQGLAVAIIAGPTPRVYVGFSQRQRPFWRTALDLARQADRRRRLQTGWRSLDREAAVALATLTVVQGGVGVIGLFVFSDLLPELARTIGSPVLAGWIPAVAQASVTLALIAWQALPALGGWRPFIALLFINSAALAAMALTRNLPLLVLESAVVGAATLQFMVAGSLIAQVAHARARGSAGIVSGLAAGMLGIGSLVRWGLIEIAQALGWPAAFAALALLACTSALVLARARPPLPAVHTARRETARRSSAHLFALLAGAAVVFLGSLADAAVASYQPVALTQHAAAAAVGPFAWLLFAGGVLAGVVVNACAARRELAVPIATAAVGLGALACWGTQQATGAPWLVWEVAGRLLLETGSTVFALSLGAIYAERFGAPERFAKAFALARALAASVAALVTIGLWAAGGWEAIAAFAVVAAALLLLVAPVATLTLRR
jgi:hypothetical protein